MSWGIVLLRALLVVFFIGSIVVVNSQSSRPKKTQALRDFKNGARRAGIQHQDPAEYMGKGLSPEEKFHRVPLRPRMSNENWKKWAGPLLTKKYDVRKGDSLWVISKRLFGNPHLWPKVWELNSVFRNAHIIDPNVRLYFFPGNPQSTPIVSVKNLENPEVPLIPFPSRYQRLSLLERVAEDLKALSSDGLPAFRSYMAMQRPPVVARMPKIKDRERFFWRQGDELYLRLPVGKYFVVEHEELGLSLIHI